MTNQVRNNVSFFSVNNGFSTFFGEGKEVTLNNGSCFAKVNGQWFRVVTTNNDSWFVKL